jgi:CheY-like chemotaxis protein
VFERVLLGQPAFGQARRAADWGHFAASGDDRGPNGFGRGFGGGTARRLVGKRILIVEDEALVALDLELAFEDEGAEIVGPALTLRDALEVLRGDQTIDGAVLDVDLGGSDVFPVAERLRERGIPFVFHTGHATPESLEALFPGAITCTKPTLPAQLVSALLRVRH